MTEKITLVEFDGLTGLETTRELTPDELAEREQLKAEQEAAQELITSKETARESALAKLAALGLTEEEIAAL
jgi:DNA-binding NarL/FixJ family response regulator